MKEFVGSNSLFFEYKKALEGKISYEDAHRIIKSKISSVNWNNPKLKNRNDND